MEVTIRNADIPDLPAILEIVNHAIEHTTAIYDYDKRSPETHREWFDEKIAGGFPVIVAETDGQVVGFGSYGTFKPKIGYRFSVEHSVYVADGFTGKGIGTKLLKKLIAVAKAQKIHVMVGYIDTENSGSIVFHKQFGFVESGVLREVGFKFGKWLSVSIMQLNLDESYNPGK